MVTFELLHPLAKEPSAAYPGDAAFDLTAIESVTIDPESPVATVRTGVSVRIVEGQTGLVCSRSGLASNHGVFVLNSPGVLDSSYTGEISVILGLIGNQRYEVKAGDRIAQLIVVSLAASPKLTTPSSNAASSRGAEGFGSSGR